MADKRLIDNESSTTVDKFYGNKGGKDVQIPLADAASVLAGFVYNNNSPVFTSSVAIGEEVDTNLAGIGVYLLTSNASGYAGLLIIGHVPSADFILVKNGLGFSNESGVTNTLRIYRKETNGNLFVINNYTSGSNRHIRIRKIASY